MLSVDHQMSSKLCTVELLRRVVSTTAIVLISLTGLYGLVASPPLHLFYGTLPHAGSNSVYVPGSGFAGFWYHMGLFHNLLSPNNPRGNYSNQFLNSSTNFYCYSSGCLSVLLSALQLASKHQNESTSIMELAYDAAFRSQTLWMKGEINQYDIVETFLQEAIINPIRAGDIEKESVLTFLPRLHILITTGADGAQIRNADSVEELINLLRRTTWIPFVTGSGFGRNRSNLSNDLKHLAPSTPNLNTTGSKTDDDWFLDGGFSRVIHPPCERTISVPTNWLTILHTLNPGLSRETVLALWTMGFDDSLLFSVHKKQPRKGESASIISIAEFMMSYITTFRQ